MYCNNHTEKPAVGSCVYCGKLFCEDCLVEVNGKMYCKADIGNVMNETKKEAAAATASIPNIVINNSNNNTNTVNGMNYVCKSKTLALVLCIFLGVVGVHRFYVGKIGTGLIWLLTGGLFGIGWIFDIVLILTGSFRDKANMPLA